MIGFLTCLGVHKWVTNLGITFYNIKNHVIVSDILYASDTIICKTSMMASDKRLKENIKHLSINDMIKMTSKIEPVSYNFIDTPTKSHYGVIAQQTRKVMPTIVSGDEKKEMLRVNYTELTSIIPLLCKKIITLESKIDNNLK